MVHQIGMTEEADGRRLESTLLVRYHEFIVEEGRMSIECGKADPCGRIERKEKRYAQVRRRRWE
jgi:hypothetical protein